MFIEEHRVVDLILVRLPVGVAATLLVMVFEKKLRSLIERGHHVLLLAFAGLCIVFALALINAKVVNFVIPLPVPSIRTTTSGFDAFVQACMAGSVVVLIPLFVVLNDRVLGKFPGERIFGDRFLTMFLATNTVLQLTKWDFFPLEKVSN